jgi:hypothetical protein
MNIFAKVKSFGKDMVYGYMYQRVHAQAQVAYDEMKSLEESLSLMPDSERIKNMYEIKKEEFENLEDHLDDIKEKWNQ